MLSELIKSVFYAGIPVALISYYLIVLTRKKTNLKSTNATEFKKELKTVELNNSVETGFFGKMLQKKFMKFGGGYYGIMILITYFHVEGLEIIDFFRNFESFGNFIDSLGFSTIIAFFVEAFLNLLTAILWPIYWFKFLPIGSLWVWLIVTIFAHSLATRIALSKNI